MHTAKVYRFGTQKKVVALSSKLSLLFLALVLVGCQTEKRNPVGGDFVSRDPGQVIDLPAIDMRSGSSFPELVFPIVLGEREELLVGQMNGFAYNSLLRFRVPVDSLAKAGGGTVASDLEVDSIRVLVRLRSARFLEHVQVGTANPTTPWEEIQTFIDTLTFSERTVTSEAIAGGRARVLGDSLLHVTIPVAHFASMRNQDPIAPSVDLLLEPQGTGDFLLDLVAREAASGLVDNAPPELEIVYRVQNASSRFSVSSIADTYWGHRVNGGPPRDLLLLSKGTFYATILQFDIPTSIPKGATFNSARLELEIDQDRSYFNSFPFELAHVEFKETQNDTIFTRYNTQIELLSGASDVAFNQGLVQAWMTGAQVNHGMALRPLGSPLDMTWLVIKRARLKLIYSLPPEL